MRGWDEYFFPVTDFENPKLFQFCETLQIPEARSSFQICSLLSFASLTNGQSHETDPPKTELEHAQKTKTKKNEKNPKIRKKTKPKKQRIRNRTRTKKACEAHQPDMVP